MKLSIFIFFLILFSQNFKAQNSDLVSRFRPGTMWFYTGLKPAEVEKVRKYDRLIFDIVYNDFAGKNVKPFKVSPLSIGFNTNLMFDIPFSKGNTVSLGTGFTYGLFHVRTNDFFARNEVSESTKMIGEIKQYGIDKSVFNLNSLSVPLELRYRGKNWKHAKIHVGAKVSYQFRAATILSTFDKGIKSQQKTLGFYDLNPINFSTHIRFGIRNWAFFASYGFMPIFKNAQSTRLNPIQFGISVSLF